MELKKGYIWLDRVREIECEIKKLCYECDELRTCVGIQGISYDKVSVVSSPKNKLEEIMARIDVLERKIKELKLKKGATILEISEKLDQLPESPEKTILYGFYIRRLSMDEIANELDYEKSWCYRLRRKGIEQL